MVTKGEDASGRTIVYRGWMLGQVEYERFLASVTRAGAIPFHTVDQYLQCHHIPRWYPLVRELTPETVFLPIDADLEKELRALGWPAFVIKDYVKSLKTSIGSVVTDPAQAPLVAREMMKFRGTIEGGFSIRRLEPLDPATERRFFVLNGRPWASDDSEIPDVVRQVARRVTGSRFYSVDVARDAHGDLRVVELGDGQVSDVVGWEPARFAHIWTAAAAANR